MRCIFLKQIAPNTEPCSKVKKKIESRVQCKMQSNRFLLNISRMMWMLIYTWATFQQNDSEYLSHLMASRIIDVDYYAGGDRKVVTSVDVYKSIRALQLEGVTSQRAAAKILGISRNTVKKYWMGDAVPWDRKAYQREASVITPEVMNYRNLENRIDVTIREG